MVEWVEITTKSFYFLKLLASRRFQELSFLKCSLFLKFSLVFRQFLLLVIVRLKNRFVVFCQFIYSFPLLYLQFLILLLRVKQMALHPQFQQFLTLTHHPFQHLELKENDEYHEITSRNKCFYSKNHFYRALLNRQNGPAYWFFIKTCESL